MHRREPANVLLAYPEFPTRNYWGMQHSLPFIGRKAFLPPLGLITIAAMCPPSYRYRLVDMNCRPMTDDDLAWADMVCFSAMLPQKIPLLRAAERCRAAGKLVVFGGPYPTACPDACRPYCDVLVLNEGETTWPAFLRDYERGTWRDTYTTRRRPDLAASPVPRFDLLNLDDYAAVPVQFSRGCPFHCEFCDIIVLFGRRPRTKPPARLIAELQALFDTGYRGGVMVVDDNFIGNKRQVEELLPDLQRWNAANANPFFFFTQASLNLADDRGFVERMVESGFKGVFLGIESPSVESLRETGKHQNLRGSLLDSVRTIQEAGLVVHAGFIVGFDNDTEDIFDRLIDVVSRAAIPNAIVELLFALPGTALWKRLERERRLEPMGVDNPIESRTNIVTLMPRRTLLEGLRRVLEALYTPRAYFERTLEHFRRLPRPQTPSAKVRNLLRVGSQAMRLFRAGSQGQEHGVRSLAVRLRALADFFRMLPPDFRRECVRFLLAFIRTCPERLPGALLFIFMGAHLCRYNAEDLIPDLDRALEHLGREQAREPEPGVAV